MASYLFVLAIASYAANCAMPLCSRGVGGTFHRLEIRFDEISQKLTYTSFVVP